ncbi:MAG: PQQ-binding-like beta-propeller repeat protein [Thermoanaerobaculia bacterium]
MMSTTKRLFALVTNGTAIRTLLTNGAVLLFAFSALPLLAAQPPKTPRRVLPESFDISPPLRSIVPHPEPRKAPQERENEHLPYRTYGISNGPDQVRQTAGGATFAPVLNGTFEGVGTGIVGYSPSVAPPDTEGEVGPNHYIQWVNTDFLIFDKNGGIVYPTSGNPAPGNTIWSGFSGGGGLCASTNQGDPLVMYDASADRWFMSQFAFTVGGSGYPAAPFYQCVAVSTSPDPTGTWYRYAFPSVAGTTDVFNDYGKSGVWRDAYYMSVNQFSGRRLQNWEGAGVYAYDRAAMLAGNPSASAIYFNLGTTYGGLLPADWDGTTPPPPGEPNFFVSFDNTSAGCGAADASGCLQLWKFHSDFATPANSSISGPTIIGVSPITIACNGAAGSCIAQAGTSNTLDTLADRLMWHLSYRNFGTHESLVVTHSVDPDGGGAQQSALRWYEIRDPNGTPSLYQQSTYNPSTTEDRWMGSIAMDKFGDIAIGYSISSASINPSIEYTGRLSTDPANTLQTEATMFPGSGSQTGTLHRWGDYSSLTVDPTDECTFWFTTEYLAANGSFNWNTRIGSFRFSTCATCSAPAIPASVVASPLSSTSNTVTWASSGAGVTYNVYRSTETCPAGIFTKLNASPVSGTSYTDTTATTGATYWYRVTAVDAATGNCESVASSCVSVTTTSCTTPGAPTGLTLTTPTSNTIHLAWTAGTPAGATYNVYRADGATCTGATLLTSGVATTSYDDAAVTGGSTYSYQVSSVDATGSCESSLSSCQTATATGGPGVYSTGTFASGSPRDTSAGQDVRWIYNSGATALAPPTSYTAVYSVSNDRRLHSMNVSVPGGDWPELAPKEWKPPAMNAPAQGRTIIVPTTLFPISGSTRVTFVSSQDGHVYCFDADTGVRLWMSAQLGDMVQAPVAIAFRQYKSTIGGLDLVFAATRNSSTGNVVYALNAATGATVWSYDNGGGASAIGVVTAIPSVDAATQRLFFTSRAESGGSSNTVWCLNYTAGGASLAWALPIGDAETAPTIRNGVLYVGNNNGDVYALSEATGTLLWSYPTGDGPIKTYVYPDWATTRLYFTTTNRVWSLTDNGPSATLNWATPASGAGSLVSPSNIVTNGTDGWVGTGDGKLVRLNGLNTASPSQTVRSIDAGSVGAPIIDFLNNWIYVGTEGGSVYCVTP